MSTSVYFNPACTNCNTVQSMLEELGVNADYVEYLERAPSVADIEDVLAKLGTDDPRVIIRTKEPVYDELQLDGADRGRLLEAMSAHPILIQRPIVIRDGRAVVARPPEKIKELFGA